MFRGLNLRHVWVALTVGAAFIGPASSPIGLPDIYWTLLRGDWMVSHGALLHEDPFTAAPHVVGDVLDVQWLADLVFHALYALGGLPMVITGTAVAVAATYAILLAAAVTASGHLRLSCVTVWLAYVLGATNLSPRPQTLAYPIFALFLLAVARAEWRKDTRLLWLLPLATAVWANVHGSFFTGFMLLGCAGLGRIVAARSLYAARPYAIALGACGVASLVNPYGPAALVYLLTISGNPIIREHVTEWAPSTLALREGSMLFVSVAVLGGLMLKSRLRLTPTELISLLVFGFLAWSSVRALVWWGLLLAPSLARLLGSLRPSRAMGGRNVPLLNALLLASIAALAVVSVPWLKAAVPILPADKQGLEIAETPVGVGAYLRSHDPPPSGRMLNAQEWGGYLEWATWPRHRVFLDGRIELHPDQVWLDYIDLVFPGADWRDVLARYDISYLVLNKDGNQDLIADLRADDAWIVDYDDDQAVVFSRAEDGPLSP